MVRSIILCLTLLLLLPACSSLMPLLQGEQGQQAEPGFQRVEQLPEGEQAKMVLGDFIAGIRNVTAVEWTYAAPYPLVWEVCKTVSARFSEVGKRAVVKVVKIDDKTGRIQNGQVPEQAPAGPDSIEWADELVIEIASISDEATKVVVSRKIVRYDEKGKVAGKTWRTQWSNGRIEWWLLTQIRDEIEKSKSMKGETAPVRPLPSPPPPSPVPRKEEGFHFAETVSVETIKVPVLELLKHANVRAKATTKSAIITTLEQGQRVEVMGKLHEWYRVKLDSGKIGWIHKKLVKQVEE